MSTTGPPRGAVHVVLAVVLAVVLVSVGAGVVTAAAPTLGDVPADPTTDTREGPSTHVSDRDTVRGDSRTIERISSIDGSFDANQVERIDRPWSDWPVPLAPVVAAYSRYDDSSPLDHETRRRIYDAILEYPGTYPLALAERVGVSRSTVRYHVRILVRERLAETEKRRGKRRIFAAETEGSGAEPLVDDPAPRAVLTAIATQEPVSVSRLAETVDRSVSTVSYHLEQLEGGGLIERERDGNTVLNVLSEDARDHLQSGDGVADREAGESSVHAD